ncbi:MAG: ATP synthase F1 subunit epsilon [Marinilabiliales bacterium]|nr:ATP synthase F1 subunit epsilon [Marinilabiliales bacterium]
MKIEIITPDKSIYSGEVRSVRVPGRKGSFQVLKDHAPIISTLEAGIVIMADEQGNEVRFEITGGVIEVKKNQDHPSRRLGHSKLKLMDSDEFRKQGHEIVEWIARYFENVEQYPVKARVAPGEVKTPFPEHLPPGVSLLISS